MVGSEVNKNKFGLNKKKSTYAGERESIFKS